MVRQGRHATMRAMRTSRRFFALVAAFAVAFGALWPLVSVAHPGPPSIPSFICTQSGFQHQDLPGDHHDKFHCPLCVMTVDSVAPPPAAVTFWTFASQVERPERIISLFAPRFLAQPPPSRAPPLHS
jgi:Protein of unknown function (DUF2946)